jgi:hypothetical protein
MIRDRGTTLHATLNRLYICCISFLLFQNYYLNKSYKFVRVIGQPPESITEIMARPGRAGPA